MQKNTEIPKRLDPFKVTICPTCGKEFVKAPIPVLGDYCKPTCKLKAEREKEELLRQRGEVTRREREERAQKRSKGQILSRPVLRKPVSQHTIDGVFVAIYDSVRSAADHIGVSEASISMCCRGQQKTAKGYVWKYADKGSSVIN